MRNDHKELQFTAITVIRGESDIAYSSLYHHARLGFDRLIIVSHVEHAFMRVCVHKLRQEFSHVEFVVIEIDSLNGFSRFKGQWVNGALAMLLDSWRTNIVYGFDADEFLCISSFSSISDLISKFVSEADIASALIDQPALLHLPWANLLPCRQENVDREDDLDCQFLSSSYFQIVNPIPILSKMIFVYKPGVRIHMGYHFLINARNKQEISVHPSSKSFVGKHGLCVHHIPLRKMSQFQKRLSAYRTSADSEAKYNRINHAGADLAESLFKSCMRSSPQYKSIEEASVGLNYKLDPQRDKTFVEYLTLPRLDVDKVLSRNQPKRDPLGSQQMMADISLPPS